MSKSLALFLVLGAPLALASKWPRPHVLGSLLNRRGGAAPKSRAVATLMRYGWGEAESIESLGALGSVERAHGALSDAEEQGVLALVSAGLAELKAAGYDEAVARAALRDNLNNAVSAHPRQPPPRH